VEGSDRKKLTVVPLVAATYFMVSGGPYGLEELVAGAGFAGALVVLALTPFIWSLPTALMVGELGGAVPEEGGYYAWVRRALGPFWGFQEAWLSLAASAFDMAIYPTLFTLYVARLFPALGQGAAPTLLGAGMILACALWNMRGAHSVGGASVWMTVALLGPFALMSLLAVLGYTPKVAPAPTGRTPDFIGGVLVAMWNYMGWDNASTVASEVERPQHTYPRAMIAAVALVAITYVIPVAAASRSGLDPRNWTTGSWVDVAGTLGTPALAAAVVIGGALCAFGMFNALVLSYSRLPVALAADGWLPGWLGWRHPKTGAPIVSIAVCAVTWAACLGLGFNRLILLDVILYGLSLLLEFAALVVLRLREPDLERPFRVPGGMTGAVLLGLGPMAVVALAVWRGAAEEGAGSALRIGGLLLALGPAIYFVRRLIGFPAPATPPAA
jgi:amino acid transporter